MLAALLRLENLSTPPSPPVFKEIGHGQIGDDCFVYGNSLILPAKRIPARRKQARLALRDLMGFTSCPEIYAAPACPRPTGFYPQPPTTPRGAKMLQ